MEGRLTEEQLLNFRQEGSRQGHLELSAPQADARVLAVPDRVDGAGAADGDLPGALPQVPARARHRRHVQAQGLGLLRRRRDGRARIARRHRPGGAREARQPGVRHQLQPAAAGRPGARQRQDHPGVRGRVPRRRLERHQADLGQQLGPAAGARQGRRAAQGHDGHAGRRLPGLQGQRRRLRAQALLRPRSAHAGDGGQDERQGHLEPATRRPRLAEGLRRLPPRQQPRRPADRAAGQDGQGLRHGRCRRGQEHRAPDQEAQRRRHPLHPRPLQHPDPRQRAAQDPVLQAGRRHAGDEIPARTPSGAGRLPAQAPHAQRRAVHRAVARDLPAGARRHRRRPRDQHHAGLRALPDHPAARQGAGAARGADPGRRGAHLRHGRPVPPDRHLQPRGPEVHAGRQGPGHVLPRGQGRADPAGRHQRTRRHGELDRRGDLVLDEQPHHGAVLRLLLDVRLPAHRRPGLGGRRHAGARLPARRHQRPHDAQRRGPAARGRPQPHPGRHDPELHQLRPDLRARGGRDPAPRPEAHGREAGQRLLLHHPAQRELPDARA